MTDEVELVELTAAGRALEALGVGYVALDARWRYLVVNQTAATVGMSTPAAMLGAVLWERYPATVGSEFEERYREAVTSGRAQSFQAHYPPPLDIWVEVVAVPRTGPGAPERACVLEVMFTDVTADRAHQAQAALAAEVQRASTDLATRAAEQQAGLVRIAQALAAADTQDEIVAVVGDQGRALLGANGCGICLRDPDGEHVSTVITDSYADVRPVVQRVPVDFPLPAIASAAQGHTLFLPDRAAAERAFPGSAEIYAGAGVQASAAVPLVAHGELLGCLSVGFAEARRFTPQERDLMGAFAALTAQAVDRSRALARERAASEAVARFSETMQRSLLGRPVVPDYLQIAVRYAPAAAEALVGGDWYDVFTTRDGATNLVIGDVAGHDRTAAAAMAQLRNMLRGIAYTSGGSPAAVLTALDDVAEGLGINTVATALLARIEPLPEQSSPGLLVRWSNAGHPPPLLLRADGTVRFLDGRPELLLGATAGVRRTDRERALHAGDLLLLFTDGLVERRRAHLDRGMSWLEHAARSLQGMDPEDMCDHLLGSVGGELQDDVALLAVRVRQVD